MEAKISKTQIRRWFYDAIKPVLKEHGFTVAKWQGLQLPVRKTNQIIDWIYVDIFSPDQLCFAHLYRHYNQVELLLHQITGLAIYEEGSTIRIAPPTPLLAGDHSRSIEKQADIEPVRLGFVTTFLEHYLPALNRYKDPANVLKLWDGLTTTEERNGHFQGPDKYIKILIISKLANDFLYEERCNESIQFYQKHIADGLLSAQKWLELCHKVIDYLHKHDTISDL